jgi:hypothetical protein
VFSPNNPDNPNMTAGMTFFGQFLDHDVRFDKKSLLNASVSPTSTVNFRTAAFDLDPEHLPGVHAGAGHLVVAPRSAYNLAIDTGASGNGRDPGRTNQGTTST